MYIAAEAFFAGTEAEVTPILSIDRHPVGDCVIGPLAAMAHDAYFGAVRDGSAPHPEWQGNRPAEAFVGSQGGAMLILHR